VRRGLVRHIGTLQHDHPKLELLCGTREIRPVANEMELHPHFQQPELLRYGRRTAGWLPIAYSPIGSPGRPERDRTPEDTVDVEDPVILAIARRLVCIRRVVCVKWAVQRGPGGDPVSRPGDANYLANCARPSASR